MNKAQMHPVNTNAVNGPYRPMFFDLSDFNLSEVKLDSVFYSDESIDPEFVIIKKEYSFCYLREDKLKLVHAFDKQGIKIGSEEFLLRFGIELESSNLFKSGKYLSRVFRPVRYGGFYSEVDVFIQENKPIELTDGISLISLKLAKSLGWDEAEHGASAQFTLYFNEGLVKGHCVVSSVIEHDVVIYSKKNIKSEIKFNFNNLSYITVEHVKLSKSLRMDIQSMLNLWGLFGAEQYLIWASRGIIKYKSDLLTGKLNNWPGDETGKEEDEKWVLKRAINNGIDYRHFPGLFRMAWTMFRNSIMRYAENKHREPIFRIPVPNGVRAYIRIDLTNHGKEGDFHSELDENEIYIDKHGNAFFSEKGFEYKMKVLGGADQDDSIAIIPLANDQAVVYRNPNQFGEFLILNVKADEVVFDSKEQRAKLIGNIPIKEITPEEEMTEEIEYDNPLINYFLRETPWEEETLLEYSTLNLLRSYTAVIKNTANIGYAANAEMILSAIRITDEPLFNELRGKHSWNLEKIIDGTVKEGSNLKDEILKIQRFFEEVSGANIPIPKSLKHRIPEGIRNEIKYTTTHKLDLLLEAIKFIIEQANIEILGKGTISKGNRIPGIIDRLEIPIEKIAFSDEGNPMYSTAIEMLYNYNSQIAQIIETTKEEEEEIRIELINEAKEQFLKDFNRYSYLQRNQITNAIAYQLYKSSNSIHDSILWIADKEHHQGTATSMIELINPDNDNSDTNKDICYTIRVWSKKPLDANNFSGITKATIINSEIEINNATLNIGDEHKLLNLPNGKYKVISISQSRSRRFHGRKLANSLDVVLTLDN